MLKNNFGTIRGCERVVDVFFHFDALEDALVPADLAVGDDVEFSVHKDPGTKKVAAVR
jgi:cold shock CspA family protein